MNNETLDRLHRPVSPKYIVMIRITVLFLIMGLLGHLSNMFIMHANGGNMPVWMDSPVSVGLEPGYIPLTQETKYRYLADYIPIDTYSFLSQEYVPRVIYDIASYSRIHRGGLASPGDILIWISKPGLLIMMTLLLVGLIWSNVRSMWITKSASSITTTVLLLGISCAGTASIWYMIFSR